MMTDIIPAAVNQAINSVTDPNPTLTIIKDILLVALSTLATIVSILFMFILTSFKGSLRRLSVKVEKLEADRSAVAVMATQMSNLAKMFEDWKESIEIHHSENKAQAKADREETQKWRTETFAPMMNKLVEDNIVSKLRIEQLMKRGPRTSARNKT